MVNKHGAKRCRRCRHSFVGLDPALESELLVSRIRRRRLIPVLIAVALVAGLAYMGLAYRASRDRLARFEERAHVAEVDVTALMVGAKADAELIDQAVDDAEVERLLESQASSWSDRVEQCRTLTARLQDLVPQNPTQTARELALERRLAVLQNSTEDIIKAVSNKTPFQAKVAASRILAIDSAATSPPSARPT